VQHVVQVDLTTFPEGFHSRRLATSATGIDSCMVLYSRVPPGHHGPKLHTHPVDQIYFVLDGSLEIQVGNKKMTAGPRSLVVLPAGTLHANFNPGPGVERHIALLVPEPPDGARLDYGVEIVPQRHRPS